LTILKLAKKVTTRQKSGRVALTTQIEFLTKHYVIYCSERNLYPACPFTRFMRRLVPETSS